MQFLDFAIKKTVQIVCYRFLDNKLIFHLHEPPYDYMELSFLLMFYFSKVQRF